MIWDRYTQINNSLATQNTIQRSPQKEQPQMNPRKTCYFREGNSFSTQKPGKLREDRLASNQM